MKRHVLIKSLAVALAVLLAIAAVAAQAEQTKRYAMNGRISAIDQSHDTVVVEVPVHGGDQFMTVGGPLVPDAKLRKDGQSVGLDAFWVGEMVRVQWRKLETGLKIERLVSLDKS